MGNQYLHSECYPNNRDKCVPERKYYRFEFGMMLMLARGIRVSIIWNQNECYIPPGPSADCFF